MVFTRCWSILLRRVVFCFVGILSLNYTFGQGQELTLIINGTEAGVGEQICLPVTPKNFDDILGMQMTFGYDPEVLDFESVSNPNAALRIDEEFVQDNFGYPEIGNVPLGRITFFWVAAGTRPISLDDDTVLFELCFTVLDNKSTIVGFFESPTPIQIVDKNDMVIGFNGIVGTVNGSDDGPSFQLSKDTSFMSFDFSVDPINNQVIVLNHLVEVINTTSDTLNLNWELIENEVPAIWNHICFTETLYNGTYNCEQDQGDFQLRTTPEVLNFHFQVDRSLRQSGTAVQTYSYYDPSDRLNTEQTITFITEFIVPSFSGAPFVIDTNEIDNEVFVNSASQFPIELNYDFNIRNQLPIDEVNVKWELINSDIPQDWMTDCISAPDCPLSEEIFNLEPGGVGNRQSTLIIQDAPQRTDTATISYLVYDTRDSANTRQIIDQFYILSFPELTTPIFNLTPDSLIRNFNQDNSAATISINEILQWNFSSIFPRLINFEILKFDFPMEWEKKYVLRLGNRSYQSIVNPLPTAGSFILSRDEAINSELNLEVSALNDTPGAFELDIQFYDATDSLTNHQIVTITYNLCPPVAQTSIIQDLPQTTFCPGDSIAVSAVGGFSSYTWGNGATGPNSTIPVDSIISIEAKDVFGCTYLDFVETNISRPFTDSICLITVDPQINKNVLVWNKTADQTTVAYRILRETAIANDFELIGEVDFDSPNEYIDASANPLEASARYTIQSVNGCGDIAQNSPTHKTLHLTSNKGINGEINLIWDPYEGFDYPTFRILRGNSPNNMQIIAQRPSSTFTFTDLTPPTGQVFLSD